MPTAGYHLTVGYANANGCRSLTGVSIAYRLRLLPTANDRLPPEPITNN